MSHESCGLSRQEPLRGTPCWHSKRGARQTSSLVAVQAAGKAASAHQTLPAPPIYLRTHLESGARQPFHVERSGGHELHTAPRRRRLLDRRRAGVSPRGGCPPAPDGLPPGPHGSRTTPLGPTDSASLGENPAEFRCGESRFPRRRLSPDAPVPTVQAEVSYFNRLLTLTRHRTARGPKGWCSCHEPSRLRTGE